MKTLLASLGLAICLLLLLHMALGAQARERIERIGRPLRADVRARAQALRAWITRRLRHAPPQPSAKVDPKAARQLAEEAIQRARSGSKAPDGVWHGNVFRPKGVDWSGPPDRETRDPPRD